MNVVAASIFSAAQIADIITTKISLNLGGEEINPIMIAAGNQWWLVKLVIVAFVAFTILRSKRIPLVYTAIGISATAPIFNLIQIYWLAVERGLV